MLLLTTRWKLPLLGQPVMSQSTDPGRLPGLVFPSITPVHHLLLPQLSRWPLTFLCHFSISCVRVAQLILFCYTPAMVNLIHSHGSDSQVICKPSPSPGLLPPHLSSLSLLYSSGVAFPREQPLRWLLGPWLFQVFPERSFSKPSDFVAPILYSLLGGLRSAPQYRT